jgi:hypothetical protein
LDAHFSQVDKSPFHLSMRMFADAMGVTLDDVTYHSEVAATDRDLTIAADTIAAGTITAMKMCLDAWVHGRPAVAFELIWRGTRVAGRRQPVAVAHRRGYDGGLGDCPGDVTRCRPGGLASRCDIYCSMLFRQCANQTWA